LFDGSGGYDAMEVIMSDQMTIILSKKLREFLQTVKDEGTDIDVVDIGGTDFQRDLLITVDGVEYRINIEEMGEGPIGPISGGSATGRIGFWLAKIETNLMRIAEILVRNPDVPLQTIRPALASMSASLKTVHAEVGVDE
jgi:hypothetical protein